MSMCLASGHDTQQAAPHTHTSKKVGATDIKAYTFHYLGGKWGKGQESVTPRKPEVNICLLGLYMVWKLCSCKWCKCRLGRMKPEYLKRYPSLLLSDDKTGRCQSSKRCHKMSTTYHNLKGNAVAITSNTTAFPAWNVTGGNAWSLTEWEKKHVERNQNVHCRCTPKLLVDCIWHHGSFTWHESHTLELNIQKRWLMIVQSASSCWKVGGDEKKRRCGGAPVENKIPE